LKYLLDTNVVSEWVKPRPNADVVRWLAAVDEDAVYLSVVTFGELGQGIAEMAPGRRQQELKSWLDHDLYLRFERRILPIDYRVARAWSILVAQGRKSGRMINPMDAFLAATAEVHSLTLVTRNAKDFLRIGVPLFDPWNPAE
jgi:toxin FitB